MRDARRTSERSSAEEIVRHIKRFGPIHTAQIANSLGLNKRTLVEKLPTISGLHSEVKQQKTYWSVIN